MVELVIAGLTDSLRRKGSNRLFNLCTTTVCSGDRFSYYIPLFIYTLKRAYPEEMVKVFLRGKLNGRVKDILKEMRDRKMCDKHWSVLENQFEEYPHEKSTLNSLRFLLPAEEFVDCRFVYITDVDFIFFKQKKPPLDYFSQIMGAIGLPYAAVKGPTKKPFRKHLKHGWTGKYLRVAGGTVVVKSPEWFSVTKRAVEYYRKILKNSTHDDFDKIKAATYREYDEVMLGRIIRMSEMPVPMQKNRFINGVKIDSRYRHIHLGDFKFKKRWTNVGKMERILNDCNIKGFMKMELEPEWQRISSLCSECEMIDALLNNLREHVVHRGLKIK